MSKWKYAKTLKDMPHKSGKYLFMTGLGVFFVGKWDAHDRALRVHSFEIKTLCSGIRRLTGNAYLARWNFKAFDGHVFWKDIGDLDYLKVYDEGNGPTSNS